MWQTNYQCVLFTFKEESPKKPIRRTFREESPRKRMRNIRMCGKCDPCNRKEDCGKCKFCKVGIHITLRLPYSLQSLCIKLHTTSTLIFISISSKSWSVCRPQVLLISILTWTKLQTSDISKVTENSVFNNPASGFVMLIGPLYGKLMSIILSRAKGAGSPVNRQSAGQRRDTVRKSLSPFGRVD